MAHTKTLLIEPFGGMAGDMFLAALLDLGDPRFTLEHLRELAEALVPGEAVLDQTTVWRGSLSGNHLSVVTPETTAPPHRGLRDLEVMVQDSALPEPAQAMTIAILTRIAVAEGKVHGCSPEEVHFHEVGAVDTLIDVGGAALGIHHLGIERVFCLSPRLGGGTVNCAHGEMPVPAPATAEILRGWEQRMGAEDEGERCTPTGAAILAELAQWRAPEGSGFGGPSEGLTVESIGYGAGTRDPKTGPPNLLRVQMGHGDGSGSEAEPAMTAIDEVAVNLDDMSPEEVGELVQRLRSTGALEVWSSSVMMKKDRPGVLVTALVRPESRQDVLGALFEASSTFGVRWTSVTRMECGRRFQDVSVGGETVRVKIRTRPDYPDRSPDGPGDLFVEHDDLVRLADGLGVPLRVARARVLEAFDEDPGR